MLRPSTAATLLFPHSRVVLQEVLDTDLSNEAFPFSTHKLATAAGCTVGRGCPSSPARSVHWGDRAASIFCSVCPHTAAVGSWEVLLLFFFFLEKAKNWGVFLPVCLPGASLPSQPVQQCCSPG